MNRLRYSRPDPMQKAWRPSADLTAATRFEQVRDPVAQTRSRATFGTARSAVLPRAPRGNNRGGVRLPALPGAAPAQPTSAPPQSVADFVANPSGARGGAGGGGAGSGAGSGVDLEQLLRSMDDLRSLVAAQQRQIHDLELEVRSGVPSEFNQVWTEVRELRVRVRDLEERASGSSTAAPPASFRSDEHSRSAQLDARLMATADEHAATRVQAHARGRRARMQTDHYLRSDLAPLPVPKSAWGIDEPGVLAQGPPDREDYYGRQSAVVDQVVVVQAHARGRAARAGRARRSMLPMDDGQDALSLQDGNGREERASSVVQAGVRGMRDRRTVQVQRSLMAEVEAELASVQDALLEEEVRTSLHFPFPFLDFPSLPYST